MKNLKLILSSIIICLIMLISTLSSAVSVTLEDKEVKPGEEFTVEIKLDENIVLGNSHIKFDSDLFEFIGTSQSNLSANEQTAGDVAWMYTDMNENSEGINTLKFNFKTKDNISKKQESTMELFDLQFVTVNNENSDEKTIGDTNLTVKVKGKSNGLIICVIVVVIILIVIFRLRTKSLKGKH